MYAPRDFVPPVPPQLSAFHGSPGKAGPLLLGQCHLPPGANTSRQGPGPAALSLSLPILGHMPNATLPLSPLVRFSLLPPCVWKIRTPAGLPHRRCHPRRTVPPLSLNIVARLFLDFHFRALKGGVLVYDDARAIEYD